MTTTLKQKFAKAIGSAEKNGLIRVKLGKIVPAGFIVDVPNQPGKVYIRVYKNAGVSLTTAVNRGAPLAVSSNDDENDYWVRRDPKSGDYEIVRRIEIVDSDQPVKAKTIPPHRHNIGSGMEDPVEDLRFLPGLVHKKTGNTVRVRKFAYRTATGYAIFSAQDFDISSYIPSSDYKRAWVVVGFDPDTATVTAVTGDEYTADVELENSHIADITVNFVPLVAIKTQHNQTAVEYTDFVDLRQHFATTSTVSSAAPIDARYWISESNGDLTNGVNLGALTSGLLKHNVTAGVSTPATATSADVVGAIDDGDLPGAKIADNSITALQIAPDAITSSELADDAVTTDKIADGAVTAAKLSGTIPVGDYVDLPEQSPVPGNPAATAIRIYSAEQNGHTEFYSKDSTGLVRNLSRDYVIIAKNETGSTIAAGKVVKLTPSTIFSGTTIIPPLMALAVASNVSTASGIMGITAESVANGATGRVVLHGFVYDVVNTASAPSNVYWLSGTTPGEMTTTRPTYARMMGICVSDFSAGTFYLNVQPMEVDYYLPKYWTSEASALLGDEVNLGALTSGLLKHTVSGGVSTPATAVVSTDYVAPNTGSNVINTNMITNSAVTDVKIAAMTATKLRGTSGRLPLLQGTGSAATEFAGSSANDYPKWDGNGWVAAGNGMAEIAGFQGFTGASVSISSIPSGYTHLLLMLMLRTDNVATFDTVIMRFNSDSSAANYYNVTSIINHNAVLDTSQNLAATTGFRLSNAATGDNSGGNLFGVLNVWIYNYLSSGIGSSYKINAAWQGYKPGTATGDLQAISGGGHYQASVAALTSITLVPSAGSNFSAGSAYALYGIG